MRASVEQVRDLTLDAIDTARRHGDDAVGAGASQLSTVVEHVTDRLPVLDVRLTSPLQRRRTRRRRVLLVAIVGVVAAVVVRQVMAAKAVEATAGHNAPKASND